MSHAFPLARSAADALKAPGPAALTRHDADALAGDEHVTGLETEWLTLSPAEAEVLLPVADVGVGDGFIQRYESADGAPVLAVTYWKLTGSDVPEPAPEPAPQPETDDDHTDDLYFRVGRTKKRGRKRKVDPNQLDLFGGEAE